MICWAPIIIHGALVCAWISNDLSNVSGVYVKVIEAVKKLGILKKVSDSQSYLWTLRHDIEVMMGIYLTLGILIGLSSILTALLYWQVMRMRYLMSPACQQAYVRLDQSAEELFKRRWCPQFVATVYGKVRSFLKGQIDSTVNQAQGGQQPGGISGAFARATQGCSIF